MNADEKQRQPLRQVAFLLLVYLRQSVFICVNSYLASITPEDFE